MIGGVAVLKKSKEKTVYRCQMPFFSFALILITLIYLSRYSSFKEKFFIISKGLLYAFTVFALRKFAFWLNGQENKKKFD